MAECEAADSRRLNATQGLFLEICATWERALPDSELVKPVRQSQALMCHTAPPVKCITCHWALCSEVVMHELALLLYVLGISGCTMASTEPKPFSGGKARSWVPRACDRCELLSVQEWYPELTWPRPETQSEMRWVCCVELRCKADLRDVDETVPCKNCADVGVKCTHDAPVLKRGPRPR
jgi:hypothetical protein